jgi:hypothetical protein
VFNETSQSNPKLAWQGRLKRHPLPYAIGATGGDDRFYAPGYGPGVVESPGFLAPDPPQIAAQAAAPAAIDANTPAAPPGGIIESVTGIFSGMETWQLLALAGAAYYFFLRKGR